MRRPLLFLLAVLFCCGCTATGQPLVIIQNGKSAYAIALPQQPLKSEERAAAVLQAQLQKATGAKLPIIRDAGTLGEGPRINVGGTTRAKVIDRSGLKPEGYLIEARGGDVFIAGGSGKGPVYGAYAFLERYAGARKFDAGPGDV